MKSIAPLLRKKWLLAVIAAAVVGSGAYAFAATLTTTSATLGAGNSAVTSCASSIDATYTSAYSPTVDGHYAVDSVTLKLTNGSVRSCAVGDKIEVVLESGASPNAALASFVYTFGTTDSIVTNKTLVVSAGSATPAGTIPDTGALGVIGATPGTLAGPPTGATGGANYIDATAGPLSAPAKSVTGIAVSAVGLATATS